MQVYNIHDLLEAHCKATQQWGMYINIYIPDEVKDYREVVEAAPYLSIDKHAQLMSDGEGCLFGTQDEIQDAYDRTVGDDGPTHLNSYNGKLRVYALTCNSSGEFCHENT